MSEPKKDWPQFYIGQLVMNLAVVPPVPTQIVAIKHSNDWSKGYRYQTVGAPDDGGYSLEMLRAMTLDDLNFMLANAKLDALLKAKATILEVDDDHKIADRGMLDDEKFRWDADSVSLFIKADGHSPNLMARILNDRENRLWTRAANSDATTSIREALQQAVNAACEWCAKGIPLNNDPVLLSNKMYFHKGADSPIQHQCHAVKVRALFARYPIDGETE